MKTTHDFNTAFVKFFVGLTDKLDAHWKATMPADFPQDEVRAENGRRYVKVIVGTSVYAFLDKTNGNVLKPASWKSPAKHARGNIFKADSGLNCCGPYSVAYLR